jgi:hypothetical protein
MDTDELINAIRFYLRGVRRRGAGSNARLSAAIEVALWEQAELAAGRLRRLAELEPMPVPVTRHRSQRRRAQ